jgi:hypothetical protein
VCEIGRTGNESRTLASSGDYEIGCTANHPFWSEDRQEFVEAGQLRPGERVRTRLDEIAHVVQVKPRPPTKWVYNLEVQGEHVYEVGPGGVLVHNACTPDWVRKITKSQSRSAEDILKKGVHITVDGVELKVLPGHARNIVFKPVHSTANPKAVQKAIKKAEEALKYPEMRNWLKGAAKKGIEQAREKGEAEFLEFRLLRKILEGWK